MDFKRQCRQLTTLTQYYGTYTLTRSLTIFIASSSSSEIHIAFSSHFPLLLQSVVCGYGQVMPWYYLPFKVIHLIIRPAIANMKSRASFNTLNAGIGFTERKSVLLAIISVILTCISWINEPIPGMFVLTWIHFWWWFQILSQDFTILKFMTILWHFWQDCRLLTPAACKIVFSCLYHRCL